MNRFRRSLSGRTARISGLSGLCAVVWATAASVTFSGLPAPAEAMVCSVRYQFTSQRVEGFTATISFENRGRRLDGWRLRWSPAPGQGIVAASDAEIVTGPDQVTASSVAANRSVAPDAVVSFSVRGTWSQSHRTPRVFSLNNRPCAVVPDRMLRAEGLGRGSGSRA